MAAVAAYVPAAELNRLLGLGYARAEKLEPKLVAILQPILEQAGMEAARRFEALATDHLAASLAGDGTKADVTSSSGMVALYPTPEQARALAESGGEPAEVMHVTLCYLGKEVSQEAAERFAAALGPVAATHPPLEGHVGGIASFDDNGGGHPSILLPDVPGLVELRQAVCEAVLAAGGDYPREHGFMPHLTVAYRDGGPLPPDAGSLGLPLSFGSVCVVVGNEVVAEHPLTGAASLTAAGEAAWSAPAGDELVDVDALVSKLRTKTDPVRMAVVETMMTPTLAGAGLAFDTTNPLTAKVLAQAGSQVTGIADTTRLNVMRVIKASADEGLTIPDTAKAIRAGMREASTARATLIARTEIVGAINGGSLAATQIVSEATGVEYTKVWLTSPGAVYPRHEDYEGLDGQAVGLDEQFDVGGDMLDFPGDPSGSPEEVCNCRCTMAYEDSQGGETEAEGDAEGGFDMSSGPPVPMESIVDDSAVSADDGEVIDDALGSIASVHDFPAEAPTLRAETGKALAYDANEGALLVPESGLDATDVHGVVHEYGHFLDRQVFGPEGRFASSVADDTLAASRGELGGVLDAINETNASKVWDEEASKSFESAPEKFARAYEQWIATRSENAEMRAVQNEAKHRGVPSYWTDADFKPVADSMDDLFRSKGLLREDAGAPRPVTKLKTSTDPYRASLEKELYSTGNKIGNLVRGKVRKGTATQNDLDRLEALKTHEANLKAWLAPPEPGVAADRSLAAEREFLLGELDQAERYYANDASTPHYVKLIKARLEQLDALEKEALPAPVTFPSSGNLAADIAQIRQSAQWISPDEASALARERLNTTGSLGEYRVPGDGAPVPEYVKAQMGAAMQAGARMEEEIAQMVARSDKVAGRRPLEQIFKDLQAADKETPEEARTFDRWYKADREHRQAMSDAEDEISFEKYGSPYSMLTTEQQDMVRFLTQKHEVVAPLLREVNEARRELNDVKKVMFEKRVALQKEYDDRRSGAALIERNAVMSALGQVRDMGTMGANDAQIKVTTTSSARGFEIRSAPGDMRELEAQKLLAQAQEFLPSEWIERFNTFETGMADRGIHWKARDGVSRIEISRGRGAVASDPDGLPTALHELVHEAEDTSALLVEQERAFYEWRTRGGSWDGPQESAQQLRELNPGSGYGAFEFAREDKFVNSYMGKHYVGQGNFELLTMGVQWLMGGGYGEAMDAEMRRWVLGMLALA